MQKILLLLLVGLLAVFKASGQDPQFSQFYAAPLYLNPAFAGSNQASRAVLNYRNQWPELDANFVTYVGSFDHYFRKYNSGIGVLAFFDKEGSPGFQSYTIAAQYAYQLHLNEKLTFRPGIQGAFSNRSLNTMGLLFGDQMDDEGNKLGESNENLLGRPGASYFDVSAGGILYSDKFWIGFSAHHMNQPNQAIVDGETSRMPVKTSLHIGYRIPLMKNNFGTRVGPLNEQREVSITPALNFKHQGPFNQLDAGVYFTYDPLTFGFWYRGIPVRAYKGGAFNNDALIFLMGIRVQDLKIGYSYDLTVSRLTPSTGGAHEISLVYDFYLGYRNQKRKTPPKNVRRMPCPDF
ncbi:MAG TPA: type IX secretion system membrane protein PorP/SprF [Cytophagales bacterium]|nr:type IX secretion system membrane protein PorP/SprF [Cytophagales bacterium]